jgi:hypothetical protein
LQLVVEERGLAGNKVSPLSGEASYLRHDAGGVGGTEDGTRRGAIRSGTLYHKLVNLPSVEFLQGTTNIVGDPNSERATRVVFGRIKINVADVLDALDGAGSPEAGN